MGQNYACHGGATILAFIQNLRRAVSLRSLLLPLLSLLPWPVLPARPSPQSIPNFRFQSPALIADTAPESPGPMATAPSWQIWLAPSRGPHAVFSVDCTTRP